MFDKLTSRTICTTKLKQGQYGHSPSIIHSTKIGGAVLSNIFHNGFRRATFFRGAKARAIFGGGRAGAIFWGATVPPKRPNEKKMWSIYSFSTVARRELFLFTLKQLESFRGEVFETKGWQAFHMDHFLLRRSKLCLATL